MGPQQRTRHQIKYFILSGFQSGEAIRIDRSPCYRNPAVLAEVGNIERLLGLDRAQASGEEEAEDGVSFFYTTKAIV
jgi:hypothetical protein